MNCIFWLTQWSYSNSRGFDGIPQLFDFQNGIHKMYPKLYYHKNFSLLDVGRLQPLSHILRLRQFCDSDNGSELQNNGLWKFECRAYNNEILEHTPKMVTKVQQQNLWRLRQRDLSCHGVTFVYTQSSISKEVKVEVKAQQPVLKLTFTLSGLFYHCPDVIIRDLMFS